MTAARHAARRSSSMAGLRWKKALATGPHWQAPGAQPQRPFATFCTMPQPLSCSAAANSGAECPFPELCDVGKNTMSKSIIVADNDDLRAAMDVGLTWTMIKWSIEVDYPALPSILQRGLNVEHHVGEGELLMFID